MRNLPDVGVAIGRDSSTATDTLEAATSEPNNKVTVFNERADRWIELSRLALLYGLPETPEMLRRAAECIVGYGWRKDLWLSEVIAAIVDVHQQGAGDGFELLRPLIPIVEEITEFTDGDETDHVRSDLIDAVAEVSPNRLPAFYGHYIRNDEFRYAAETLEAHGEKADLTQAPGKALARTLIERREVDLLNSLARKGKAGAEAAAKQQMEFLGGLPASRMLRDTTTSVPSGGSPPDVTQFAADDFAGLAEAMSDHTIDYALRRHGFVHWLSHWKERGKGLDALASIKAYFDNVENPYFAEDMLDEVFRASLELEGRAKAYPWLVRAHIHKYGWQRYWSSHEDNHRRLGWAAEHYGKEFHSFIQDSSRPSRYWQKREYGFAIGTENLVRFLLLCGQKELAYQFTETCVRIVQEEVRDQPIRDCPWLH